MARAIRAPTTLSIVALLIAGCSPDNAPPKAKGRNYTIGLVTDMPSGMGGDTELLRRIFLATQLTAPLARSAAATGSPFVQIADCDQPCDYVVTLSLTGGPQSYRLAYSLAGPGGSSQGKITRTAADVARVGDEMPFPNDADQEFKYSVGKDLDTSGSELCEMMKEPLCTPVGQRIGSAPTPS
jgi:hypothetical protein